MTPQSGLIIEASSAGTELINALHCWTKTQTLYSNG